MPTIDRFAGTYRFLSNFYPSPVRFAGATYPTVEHAFQAAKTLEPNERRMIRAVATAAGAKRLGRKVKLRAQWEEIKLDVMRDLLEAKFRDAELAKRLLATGEATLVEGNTWGDTFWGVCNGVGQNWLGLLLMAIRTDLRAAESEHAVESFQGGST